MRLILVDAKSRSVGYTEVGETDEDLREALETDFVQFLNPSNLRLRDRWYVRFQYRPTGNNRHRGVFKILGWPGEIVGRALLVGHTEDGEMCDPTTTVEEAKKVLIFL